MKSYTKTANRHKRPVHNHIPKDYWQAFNALYGRPQSEKDLTVDDHGENHELVVKKTAGMSS